MCGIYNHRKHIKLKTDITIEAKAFGPPVHTLVHQPLCGGKTRSHITKVWMPCGLTPQICGIITAGRNSQNILVFPEMLVTLKSWEMPNYTSTWSHQTAAIYETTKETKRQDPANYWLFCALRAKRPETTLDTERLFLATAKARPPQRSTRPMMHHTQPLRPGFTTTEQTGTKILPKFWQRPRTFKEVHH